MNSVTDSMSAADMPRTNRKHKERVFLKLYEDKRELLKLYNAINSTDYDNPEELEIVTLENAIYMNMNIRNLLILRKCSGRSRCQFLHRDFSCCTMAGMI